MPKANETQQLLLCMCVQPNVKPQPEDNGGESVSSPTIATTGVSNVQVGPFPFLPPFHPLLLPV